MNGACNVKYFLAPPPRALGKGQKVKYHLISITKSISKIFIRLGHAPGVGLWGHWGAQGVKCFFFKHGHVAFQIDGDDKHNRMQVTFYPRVKLVTLGEVKRSNIINMSISKIFIPNSLCVFS